jgi:hypothetical protein
MSELKSRLIRVAASMTKGRHLQNIQGLDESQKSISTRKLAIAVEEIEDRQRLDAAFLKTVFDYIVKLENKDK